LTGPLPANATVLIIDRPAVVARRVESVYADTLSQHWRSSFLLPLPSALYTLCALWINDPVSRHRTAASFAARHGPHNDEAIADDFERTQQCRG